MSVPGDTIQDIKGLISKTGAFAALAIYAYLVEEAHPRTL